MATKMKSTRRKALVLKEKLDKILNSKGQLRYEGRGRTQEQWTIIYQNNQLKVLAMEKPNRALFKFIQELAKLNKKFLSLCAKHDPAIAKMNPLIVPDAETSEVNFSLDR